MRVLMIINPVAGTKTVQKTAVKISKNLVDSAIAEKVDVFKTEKEGDAYRKALELKSGDYDCVIAVGGDGTVNEVFYGAVKSGSDVPVAVLAAGTVNDFAHSIGLPNDCDGFCKMLSQGRTEKIDLGLCQGRYFANVLAGGVLSEVAYSVSHTKKNKLGKLAYYIDGARIISKKAKQTEKLTFEYEGKVMEVDTFLFLVSNTSSVGGFRKISPIAGVNDGLLDVCIIKKVGMLGILPLFIKMRRGKHTNHRKIIYFQTDKINISCSQESKKIPLDFDGEKNGELPATVECVPQAIRLFVPQNAKRIESTT